MIPVPVRVRRANGTYFNGLAVGRNPRTRRLLVRRMEENPAIDLGRAIAEVNPAYIKAAWKRVQNLYAPHHSTSIRDEGSLETIAESFHRSYEYTSDVVSATAALVYRIVAWHPFMDCNHRTAAFLLLQVTDLAGLQPTVSDKAMEEFLKSIDKTGLEEEEVARWARANFRPL